MSRYLVTTADERSWKFDRPVLFLGEWCRLYDRRAVWASLNASVASPFGVQAEQKMRHLEVVHARARQLLQELTVILNAFHGCQHSVRYWNILLGSWLQRYVAVAFNRYFTLERALHDNDVIGTTVFESDHYSLATEDSTAFVLACGDDTWNHVLYSRIVAHRGELEVEVDRQALRGLSGFTRDAQPPQRRVKRMLRTAGTAVLETLRSERDAFIVNSFLPRPHEMALQLRLGQSPQSWQSPDFTRVRPDAETRQRLDTQASRHGGFEAWVRLGLREMLPTCYLEGYRHLVERVESLPWPSEPRFIFTSNSFDMDEVFKMWAGLKVEAGYPYFVGQHGSNYGTLRGNQCWPERVTPDAFFTWGWRSSDPKDVPAFVFKNAGRRAGQWNPRGGLALVEIHPAYRFGPEDAYFEFGQYQADQFQFVAALPASIRSRLIVRLHHAHTHFRWSDAQRWAEFDPGIAVDEGATDIATLIRKSRIVVHSYDSTGILENLALNTPTVCFWRGGLDHVVADARPYYELLRESGILADGPEQAAAIVSSAWNDVESWWHSAPVQQTRQTFCEHYSRTVSSPVGTMKRLLRTETARHARRRTSPGSNSVS